MADDLINTGLFAGVRVHCVVLEKQSRAPRRVGCWGLVVSESYGGRSVVDAPGAIPDRVAELDCADGTALGRVWESRSPPDIFVWGVGESLRGPCTGFLASPAPPFFMPRISTVRRRCAAEHPGVPGRWAMRCAPG